MTTTDRVQGLGQLQAQSGLASDIGARQAQISDSNVSVLGGSPLAASQSAERTPETQSRKDPQMYLSAAANGKSASFHYDIVDFVSGGVEEVIVVGGTGSQQVELKSGPKKPS